MKVRLIGSWVKVRKPVWKLGQEIRSISSWVRKLV
jgi:hypothetical protein